MSLLFSETAREMKAPRKGVSDDGWPRPPRNSLHHVGDLDCHEDGFTAMQAEVRNAIEVRDSTQCVQCTTCYVCPGDGGPFEIPGRSSKEAVCLRRGILKLPRDRSIHRQERKCRRD